MCAIAGSEFTPLRCVSSLGSVAEVISFGYLGVPGKVSALATQRLIHAGVGNKVCPERSSYASESFGAVNKMEGGPPLALYRQSQQTAPRCFPGNLEVLNGKGKKSCQKD